MALRPTARHVGPRDEVLANAARHAELALRDAIYMFNSGMANAGRPRPAPPGGDVISCAAAFTFPCMGTFYRTYARAPC